MKELSIEEKAKLYDKAIEKGKQILNTPYTAHWDIMKEIVEHLIPELKESEDERIKRAIITTIHLYYGEPLEDDAKEMIAWIEKFTWKPSDEQMKRLEGAINSLPHQEVLYSLYQDLSRLKR